MMTNTRLGNARALRETFLAKMAQVVAHATPSLTNSEVRLGQLLVGTGLLTEKALNTSLDIAKTVRLPLGVVLLMNDMIAPAAIERAIHVQQLIQSRDVAPSIGRMILRYATMADITVDEALDDFSIDSHASALDCWLAQVVTDCDLLTAEQIDDIRYRAESAGMTWAQYSIENAILSIDVLSAAMHAVVLMDLGHVNYADAVSLVRAVSSKPNAMPVLLRVHVSKHAFDSSTINLAAMLYASGVLTERNALDLLSLSYKLRVNPLLLIEENDLLSYSQYDLAVSVCTMVGRGLNPRSAVAQLRGHEKRTDERTMLAKWQVACA